VAGKFEHGVLLVKSGDSRPRAGIGIPTGWMKMTTDVTGNPKALRPGSLQGLTSLEWRSLTGIRRAVADSRRFPSALVDGQEAFREPAWVRA
jgi:hypothetical protein